MYEDLPVEIIENIHYYIAYQDMLQICQVCKHCCQLINIQEWCKRTLITCTDITETLINSIKNKEWFISEYIIDTYEHMNYLYLPVSYMKGELDRLYPLMNLSIQLPLKLMIKILQKYAICSKDSWYKHSLKLTIDEIIKNKQYLAYLCYELTVPICEVLIFCHNWMKSFTIRMYVHFTSNQIDINWNFLSDQIFNKDKTYIYNFKDEISDDYTIYTIDLFDYVDTQILFGIILQIEHINYPEFGILRALIRLKRIFEQWSDNLSDLYMDEITTQEYDEDTLIKIVNYLITKCIPTSKIFETLQQFNAEYGYSFILK